MNILENEILGGLLWFPVPFLESILIMAFVGLFFPPRHEKRRQLLLLLLFAAVHAVILTYGPFPLDDLMLLKTGFLLVLHLLANKILYDGKIYSILFSIAIVSIAMLLLENLFLYLLSFLFGGTLDYTLLREATLPYYMAGYFIILLKVAVFSPAYFYRLKNGILTFKKVRSYQLIFCLLFFPMGYINTILALENSRILQFDLYFFAWICTIALFILGLFLIHKMNEFYSKNQDAAVISLKNELLEKNLMSMQAAIEKNSILTHDARHHIGVLDSLAQAGDLEGLTEYISHLSREQKAVPPHFQCRNKFVEAVINVKLGEAANLDINMYCTIDYPADSIVEPLDISAILSNLIDNAFEACASLPKERRTVDIIIKPVYDNLSIRVQNTVSENPLLDNPQLKTSKKDAGVHGYGIRSVRQAAERYGGMVTFSFEDNYFCCDVTLCSITKPAIPKPA